MHSAEVFLCGSRPWLSPGEDKTPYTRIRTLPIIVPKYCKRSRKKRSRHGRCTWKMLSLMVGFLGETKPLVESTLADMFASLATNSIHGPEESKRQRTIVWPQHACIRILMDMSPNPVSSPTW